MAAFVFRDALLRDEDAIVELAKHLDTVNLPPDRAFIRALLERSVASFAGGGDPQAFDPERRFLFVLEEPATGRVVGTSMIHAQHGTHREPHVFFRVVEEERFATLELSEERREIHMIHELLQLGLTYQGPTEIGGLVLHPELRKHPLKLGRLLSLGRFLYIAAHRRRFRDRVLAELLPPLERGPQGRTRSPLWDALGGRFTNLTYSEADRLSADDKEFIWKLFPMTAVHVSLLPREVQDIIGQVGSATVGAMRLLHSVGFTYSGKVDPFDGGPHWEAATDEISLVREAQWCRVRAGGRSDEGVPGIVARVRPANSRSHTDSPWFSAVWTHVHDELPADHAIDEDAAWAVGDLPPDNDHAHTVVVAPEDLEALAPAPKERLLVALRPQQRLAN
ncbi:putative arginine N-succinyltransferase [Plesiocystis pacifica SIR-1]|uniref:Putative arginine N-succinyltransferase n=1 Tax=Plesiocystis pacifica SIR-1 TaxID=391625 RepID=A6GHR8_9BACT|nr:arginine N-succinyltransferase [Plesiocystis pacifica]EDM74564.1 putative arginine N-succinyltransferase [Plesiocystis pacifica SIR-1]